MKKSVKKLLLYGLVTAMTLSASLTALAGTWKQDHIGWWWQEDNGSYPVSTWQWIDGNNDGIAECYYFDNLGYCLLNTTTPDGYTVNADGAWTVNGIIQTKSVTIQYNNEYPSGDITGEDAGPNMPDITAGKGVMDLELKDGGDGGDLIGNVEITTPSGDPWAGDGSFTFDDAGDGGKIIGDTVVNP